MYVTDRMGDFLVTAAIDFGTTYSGYAYKFHHQDEIKSNPPWRAGCLGLDTLKTPTVLLLNPELQFDSFGYEAQDNFLDVVEDNEEESWYYFDEFKMALYDEKVSIIDNVSI